MKHVFLVSKIVIPGVEPKFVAANSIESLGDEAEYKMVFCHPRQPLGSAISECVHAFGFDPDTFVTVVYNNDEVDDNYLKCCEEVLQAHPDCTCIVGRVKPMSTPRPLVLETSEIKKIRAEDINFKADPPITFQVGKDFILPIRVSLQNLMKKWLKGRNPEHFHIYSTPNAVIYRSE